jgi:hypothetical protein
VGRVSARRPPPQLLQQLLLAYDQVGGQHLSSPRHYFKTPLPLLGFLRLLLLLLLFLL